MLVLIVIGIVPAILGAISGFKAEGRRIAANHLQTQMQAVGRALACIANAVFAYVTIMVSVGFVALAALGGDNRLLFVSLGAALACLCDLWWFGRNLASLLRGLHHSSTATK